MFNFQVLISKKKAFVLRMLFNIILVFYKQPTCPEIVTMGVADESCIQGMLAKLAVIPVPEVVTVTVPEFENQTLPVGCAGGLVTVTMHLFGPLLNKVLEFTI